MKAETAVNHRRARKEPIPVRYFTGGQEKSVEDID